MLTLPIKKKWFDLILQRIKKKIIEILSRITHLGFLNFLGYLNRHYLIMLIRITMSILKIAVLI